MCVFSCWLVTLLKASASSTGHVPKQAAQALNSVVLGKLQIPFFFFVVVAFHIFNGKNIKKNKKKKINGYKKAKDLERCYYSIHVEKSLRPARHAAKK